MARMTPDAEGLFRSLAPRSQGLLLKMEAEAEREGIAIVGPVVGRLLMLLARFGRVSAALELGSASGYSAIWLAGGLAPTGRLTCLEGDPQMADRARANLQRAGLAKSAEVLEGMAPEALDGITGPFDMIFLDIDKRYYAPALDKCGGLLRDGGLLVADNTAFADARDFTMQLKKSRLWEPVQLFCFLPGHSPERDGISLALKTG